MITILSTLICFITICVLIHLLNPFTYFEKPYTQTCPTCHVGEVTVRDYGSADQFTETITPCNQCGNSVDECRGC